MSDITNPADCTDMSQVRAGVDAVDRELVALLARRFEYMDAAARIKPTRKAVRGMIRTLGKPRPRGSLTPPE